MTGSTASGRPTPAVPPTPIAIVGLSAVMPEAPNAGAFWDLTSYLKDYPNLVSSSPTVQKAASVNGKVFGIYRPRDEMRSAVIIRKDWLQKLGLSMPKTTDDLYNIAKAFTDDDPDADMVPLDGADWNQDLAIWQRECETSRRIAANRPLLVRASAQSPCRDRRER